MVAKPKLLKPSVAKSVVASKSTAAAAPKPRQALMASGGGKPTNLKAAPNPVTPLHKTAASAPANDSALKKKDLIDSVVLLTGGKKKAVRDVVEATLKVLGDALSKGTMLNLPPFGKAKVSRQTDGASGKPMTVKLRRTTATRKPKESLADTKE